MGCIYNDNWEGSCTLWDDRIEMQGCDKEGNCICSDDPDPSYLCDSYETDHPCHDCGGRSEY